MRVLGPRPGRIELTNGGSVPFADKRLHRFDNVLVATIGRIGDTSVGKGIRLQVVLDQRELRVEDPTQSLGLKVVVQNRTSRPAVSLKELWVGDDALHQRIGPPARRHRPGGIPVGQDRNSSKCRLGESHIQIPGEIPPAITARIVVQVVVMGPPTRQLVKRARE